jgi:hypothetical protein
MIGRRMMGIVRVFAGDIARALAHFDQSLGLYDPAELRPLAAIWPGNFARR